MSDFIKGGIASAFLTLALVVGLGGGSDTKYIQVEPSVEAPKQIAGDVKCPTPPRTGGAIFVVYGKGSVLKEGSSGASNVEFLNCDYAGEWSFTVDADGVEQLQNYAGPGAIPSPRVFTSQLEINRVLTDLK